MRYAITTTAEGVLEVECRGHLDLEVMRAVCAALDVRASTGLPFALLVDVRAVTGYDPDARAHAAAWSRSSAANLLRAVGVVADSVLVAADSPATALAPRRRARLFGDRRSARNELAAQLYPASGEFARPGAEQAVAVARRAR